jgi:hypothetical protein
MIKRPRFPQRNRFRAGAQRQPQGAIMALIAIQIVATGVLLLAHFSFVVASRWTRRRSRTPNVGARCFTV